MFGKTLAAAALIAAFSLPAAAQDLACAKRSEVLKQLSARYTETPVALGLANNGGVLEILSSKTGATWTILITMPNGPTCMIAAGEHWEKLPHTASPANKPNA